MGAKTLYAKWTVNFYSVTFDKYDAAATGTMTPQSIASGSLANLKANGFTKPGWSFTGWATTPTGPVVYNDGSAYTMGTTDVTLYAIWTASSLIITYDKNDAAATGTMPVSNVSSGSSANLIANGFEKAGWSFAGWATTPTGPVAYADRASYTIGIENVVLYAKWTANQYTLTYIGNGNTGGTAPPPIAQSSQTTFTVAAQGTLTRTNFQFAGWNTKADGTGTSYAAGALDTVGLANVTLYAKWASLIDADGNVYTTVTIGTQVWMVQNLKTTKYNDGTPIPLVTDSITWLNLSTAGYCWYNNDDSNKPIYGALYNWYTVDTANPKKLAPSGWHIPSEAEWNILQNYCGGNSVAGGNLKETGLAHWATPNTGATNETGFTALPGGARWYDGGFNFFGFDGMCWSTTLYTASQVILRGEQYNDTYLSDGYYDKKTGLSVRLIRN
jgi:uncharacterized protein (TIGR02145 family)/uncharacterized repeat protein (TIGR02543 family)